jgi:invasion protein IalB
MNQATSKNRITTRSGCLAPVPMNMRSLIQLRAGDEVSKRGMQRK